jgi:hypothetical protein
MLFTPSFDGSLAILTAAWRRRKETAAPWDYMSTHEPGHKRGFGGKRTPLYAPRKRPARKRLGNCFDVSVEAVIDFFVDLHSEPDALPGGKERSLWDAGNVAHSSA